MPDHLTILFVLGLVVVALPAIYLAILGVSSLLDRKLPESLTGRIGQITTAVALVAAVAILGVMLATETQFVVIDLGNWVAIGDGHAAGADPERPHYHFAVTFVFDRLSVPFVILSLLLCGTIGSFAVRYLHREPGYHRFFTRYAMFVLGMVVASLAGTIETLFTGWELVGLSSVLLVAFFQDRPAPCRNGLRIWIIYRFSDAALLMAAVTLHSLTGEGDFGQLLGTDPAHPWPEGHTAVPAGQAFLVGFLLLLAAAGKSALVPFSGWLPRAMEGPTPSSAVFYGALSVHLGAYLLLRVSPLLGASPVLAALVILLGLTTAVYGYVVGSAQTDIKSALSFASLSQVGLIVAEIGIGTWVPVMWYVALVHLIGHACLRTLQFLRAPTLLRDYKELENAIGSRLPRLTARWVNRLPASRRRWLARFALERGYLDDFLTEYIAVPFVRFFRWLDSVERRWSNILKGRTSPLPDETRGA
jgi:NAD(P)H-quinone oxidoreductase subunit 5